MKKIFGFFIALALVFSPALASAQSLSPTDVSALQGTTFGTKNSSVQALQAFLVSQGFMQAKHQTGYFGSITSAALKKYQASVGLPATGLVSNTTLNHLQGGGHNTTNVNTNSTSVGTSPTSVVTTNQIATTSTPTTTSLATFGAKNSTVGKLQQMLIDQGLLQLKYQNSNFYGPLTTSALKQFQTLAGLNPTGVFDDDTKLFVSQVMYPGLVLKDQDPDALTGLKAKFQDIKASQAKVDNTSASLTAPAGCLVGHAFSSTTGQPCTGGQADACLPGDKYNKYSGAPCVTTSPSAAAFASLTDDQVLSGVTNVNKTNYDCTNGFCTPNDWSNPGQTYNQPNNTPDPSDNPHNHQAGQCLELSNKAVTATLTVDNLYTMFVANREGTGVEVVGKDMNWNLVHPNSVDITTPGWKSAERYSFTIPYGKDLYVATSDDHWVNEAFLGEFNIGGQTIFTQDPVWQFKLTQADRPQHPNDFPASELSDEISSGGWMNTEVKGPHGMAPWGVIPGISSAAKWIRVEEQQAPNYAIFRIKNCDNQTADPQGDPVPDPLQAAIDVAATFREAVFNPLGQPANFDFPGITTNVSVNFDREVYVDGNPKLQVTAPDGSQGIQLEYVGGAPGTVLNFTYATVANDGFNADHYGINGGTYTFVPFDGSNQIFVWSGPPWEKTPISTTIGGQ